MNTKQRMQRRIAGKRRYRDTYSYSIPVQDPENTDGWSAMEKLLFIVLRRRSLELGSSTFELSESELAGLMDAEFARLRAGIRN
jgi:hypothetical protein